MTKFRFQLVHIVKSGRENKIFPCIDKSMSLFTEERGVKLSQLLIEKRCIDVVQLWSDLNSSCVLLKEGTKICPETVLWDGKRFGILLDPGLPSFPFLDPFIECVLLLSSGDGVFDRKSNIFSAAMVTVSVIMGPDGMGGDKGCACFSILDIITSCRGFSPANEVFLLENKLFSSSASTTPIQRGVWAYIKDFLLCGSKQIKTHFEKNLTTQYGERFSRTLLSSLNPLPEKRLTTPFSL